LMVEGAKFSFEFDDMGIFAGDFLAQFEEFSGKERGTELEVGGILLKGIEICEIEVAGGGLPGMLPDAVIDGIAMLTKVTGVVLGFFAAAGTDPGLRGIRIGEPDFLSADEGVGGEIGLDASLDADFVDTRRPEIMIEDAGHGGDGDLADAGEFAG